EQLLRQLRDELTEKGPVRIEPNRTSEVEIGGDEDEQPLNEMLQSIASNRNRTHGAVLARIEKALRKLQTEPEEFGLCEDCGDEVGAGRLAAMPYAELCVACQSTRDVPRGLPTRRKLTDYR